MIIFITFVLILGILILVHELGHFVTARIFKVKAEEFGFGYPPRIFGFVKSNITGKWKILGGKQRAEKFKNTVWSLNWLPLGGFVKIKGEDGDSREAGDSFGSRKVWQRIIIMFSGVFMNFVLCFVLLSVGFMAGMPQMGGDDIGSGASSRDEKVMVMSISENSPAGEAGIELGDVLIKMDGKEISTISGIQQITAGNGGEEVELIIMRGEDEMTKKITPKIMREEVGKAEVGVGLVKSAIVSYPWHTAIYQGAKETVEWTVAIIKAFVSILVDLVRGESVKPVMLSPITVTLSLELKKPAILPMRMQFCPELRRPASCPRAVTWSPELPSAAEYPVATTWSPELPPALLYPVAET